MENMISIGLPRMQVESGERRAFLPSFVSAIARLKTKIVLEHGYGSRIGHSEQDYLDNIEQGNVSFASREEVFSQDLVLLIRYPAASELNLMRPGACLMTMVHYPTRPDRVIDLRRHGLEAVSLDSVVDDTGRRIVENLHAVAWNGVEAAFKTLAHGYPPPGLMSPMRPPIRVMLIGAGAVGSHVVQAAVRYGNANLRDELAGKGTPGVLVTVVDYDLTSREDFMLENLRQTDILIDATQRPDPSRCVIPNHWIGEMPAHAVLLDLSVDPYQCDQDPKLVKGIEGIPHGNLNKYIFPRDDSAWDTTVPDCVAKTHRRTAVSCYSWPGIYPKRCMHVYGQQVRPLIRNILEAGSLSNIRLRGKYFQRAIARAMLSKWPT
jgi:alanine dehydrogenase